MGKMASTEKTRGTYLPKRVRLLLVGESPPASGRFFYYGDSSMTRHTARAFEKAYRVGFGDDPGCRKFLDFFKECGCYLDDLSFEPVDAMPAAERKARLKACVPGLSRRIRRLKPEVVVAVLRRVEPLVREAIAAAGINPVFRALPFPGQHHQSRYVAGLSRIIKATLPATK